MSAIATALAWLPAGLTDGLSLLLWLAAAAAGLVAVFASVTYRIPAIALGIGLAAGGGWTGGFASADAQCEAAALRQQLAAARAREQILSRQVAALQIDSITAAAQAADLAALEERARALEDRAPVGVCLDADVARGVRDLWR